MAAVAVLHAAAKKFMIEDARLLEDFCTNMKGE